MQGMDEEDAGAKAAAEGGGQGEDAQADTGEARSKISAACREEVLGFRIERNSNINKNVPLGASVGARGRRGAQRGGRLGVARHGPWLLPRAQLWQQLGRARCVQTPSSLRLARQMSRLTPGRGFPHT
jgi:hypothetical protein